MYTDVLFQMLDLVKEVSTMEWKEESELDALVSARNVVWPIYGTYNYNIIVPQKGEGGEMGGYVVGRRRSTYICRGGIINDIPGYNSYTFSLQPKACVEHGHLRLYAEEVLK